MPLPLLVAVVLSRRDELDDPMVSIRTRVEPEVAPSDPLWPDRFQHLRHCRRASCVGEFKPPHRFQVPRLLVQGLQPATEVGDDGVGVAEEADVEVEVCDRVAVDEDLRDRVRDVREDLRDRGDLERGPDDDQQVDFGPVGEERVVKGVR